MSKTRADIQKKALDILVGGDVGASMSDEDATVIDGYIDDVVAELAADDTVYIGDPNDLDDALFIQFCKLVANAAAEEFGGKSDEAAARIMRNRIKTITAQKPGFGPQIVDYF
jgi:hypothetical protein